MRVLMVPHAYLPSAGGVQRVVEQLSRFLNAQGHEVRILTGAHSGCPASERIGSAAVERLAFEPGGVGNALRFALSWPSARQRIQDLVKQFRPDVVHQHVTSQNSRYAAFAAGEAGCPLVVTTHGSFERDLRGRGLEEERRHCLAAQALTHCSDAAREQFSLKHPDLREASQVIYNGVCPEDYADIPPAALSLPTVLFAGRLTSQKGVDLLLRSWKLLRAQDVCLRILGDGPERETLQLLAAELELRNVEWLPTVPLEGVIAAMKAAAVFALPSRNEGFPMGVLEAMSVGCPIVAARVGGIPEQVRDGIDGLLLPAEDPAALALALDRLLGDAALRRSLAAEAQARATRQFHWKTILPQYLAVYSG